MAFHACILIQISVEKMNFGPSFSSCPKCSLKLRESFSILAFILDWHLFVLSLFVYAQPFFPCLAFWSRLAFCPVMAHFGNDFPVILDMLGVLDMFDISKWGVCALLRAFAMLFLI